MTAILCFCPTYKNQITGSTLLATHALASHLRNLGIEFGISAISNPDIAWVRNYATSFWYETLPQYTHLLFVDDDMAFMPQVVTDMLAFGEPVVGALYPKKTIERDWAVSGIPNPQTRGPFIEVEGLGCGCFLIRRDAIKTMIEKMPELVDTRPRTLESKLFKEIGLKRFLRFFDLINDEERAMVSEDISFGRRWRECGGQVWAIANHKMVHVGPHEFSDCYMEWQAKEGERRKKESEDKIAEASILKQNPILRAKAAKHGIVVYNPNDTFIGRSIEAYGEWDEFEVETFKQFIEDSQTVVDVGANIGTHTLPLARIVGEHGKVFALEAQPRIAKILEENIRLNNLGNVYFDNKAVGAECRQVTVDDSIPDDEPLNFGAIKVNLEPTEGDLRIDMITIDSFMADPAVGLNPTLIKIDVEGMEVDVIRGAKETIKRCQPILYVDYGDRQSGEEISDILVEIDYVAFWSLGPMFNMMNIFKNQTNIWPNQRMLQANLMCVPSKMENAKAQKWARKIVDMKMQQYLGPTDTWKKAVERMAEQHGKVLQAAE